MNTLTTLWLLLAAATSLETATGIRESLAFFLFVTSSCCGLWQLTKSVDEPSRNRLGVVATFTMIALTLNVIHLPLGWLLALCAALGWVRWKNPGVLPDVDAWFASLASTLLVVWLCENTRSWSVLNQLFTGLSNAVHVNLIGREFRLGPSMWFWKFILFFGFFVFTRLYFRRPSQPSSPRWHQLSTPVLIAALAIAVSFALVPVWYLIGAALVKQFPPPMQMPTIFEYGRGHFKNLTSYLFPTNIGVLILLGVVAFELVVVRSMLKKRWGHESTPASSNRNQPMGKRVAYSLVAVTLVATTVANYSSRLNQPADSEQTAVLIHDPGFGLTHVSENLTHQMIGMLAKLPHFLRASGHEVSMASVSEEDLSDYDVLILMNLSRRFSTTDKAKIQDFVQNGGGLLCLGDHTGREGIRLPFNDLLEGTGIEFNFDSACPLSNWHPGLINFNPLLWIATDPHHLQHQVHCVGTGASLTVNAPARPVLVGKYGFSDPGVETNKRNGYLGNLFYDYGESLGDLVLVAESTLGEGRVLVFGDTSPFQSGALNHSHSFVLRVMRYLMHRGGFRWLALAQWSLAACALLALLGLLYAISHFKRSLVVRWSAMILAVGFVYKATSSRCAPNDLSHEIDFSKVALLDIGHHSSLEKWSGTETGLGGVDAAFLRQNISALHWTKPIRNLPPAKYFCLLSPQKTLAAAEVDALFDYMESGGNLIVTTGYDEQPAVAKLFDRLDVSMPYEPLGSFDAMPELGIDEEISFLAAWPLEVPESFETLCQAWQRHVIVRKRVGEGSIVLIGDGKFLMESNLEGLRVTSKPYNIRFVQSLLTQTCSQE